ncbi:RraA family protein [Pelosinus propionicus]|uniref:Putative 4-hydroxy-4-methyl-2-oxoglutarate aldolase n=1 Tax=Pelosinus propionicus DSM 13327 TaxID=1123291 RepID=A0A1I4K8V8_9FIRM|nr:RraA family protein [Pelosinus propionicus]SFL75013.1 RraA famliy [Pelosinus propionicus DSM 13327]
MSNVGCRVFMKINRPSKELVEGFRGIPVANIADEMNRFSCVDARIKPYNNRPLLGTAFTVKARVADNLLLHKALELAQPGDVIIVDAQGDTANAITGEIMMTQAAVNGLAGVVIDGAIRDAAQMQELDMPVYAAGVQPKGPYKDGPGEINVPVSCGGVVVNPGDIVVGDADGIVIISPKDAPETLKKAIAKLAKEQAIIQGIKDRVPRDKSWVDKALTKVGCEYIDDVYK